VAELLNEITMNFEEFKKSLSDSTPLSDSSAYLQSLWYDAKGDWNRAHEIIQNIEDKTAAWIHAYLHRKEGDIGNADYWYRRADKKRQVISLQEEWENIVRALL
jgi:hypothetical protein